MSDPDKKLGNGDEFNESIINELTKDLESSLQTHDNAKEKSTTNNSEPYVIEPNQQMDNEDVHPDFVLGRENKNSESKIPNKEQSSFSEESKEDFDGSETEKHSEDSEDDDDIDEIALKDNEVNLSDAEKEELRIRAEKHKLEGNERFKLMDYEASIECYTEGLRICPLSYPKDRAMIYANRAAAKMKLSKNELSIKDCTKAVEMDPMYVKAYYRRAQCYEMTEKLDECLADFNKILELDPQHQEARRGVLRLPPLIEQRNEKLKTEMLGKLKDLGNMFLRPFGLSTDNFQMVQDPETKGYSINFSQNK